MSKNIVRQSYKVNRQQREAVNRHQGKVIWFTGLSGSGKSTLANRLESELFDKGFNTYVLDGDNLRLGLNADLRFSKKDRKENLRRVAEVAKLFLDAGVVVLAAFITPFEEDRAMIKEIIGSNNLIQIYVQCDVETCEKRDVKGLYSKARKGEIKNFTGIDSPYEEPKESDLVINTAVSTVSQSLNKLVSLALQKIQNDL